MLKSVLQRTSLPAVRRVLRITQRELISEWDELANLRFRQISEGKDLSFHLVLKPFIMESLKSADLSCVVDVGCGTGNLAYELSRVADTVVGVDASTKSIAIAKRSFKSKNLFFENSFIEDFAEINDKWQFTYAVANMVLIDTLNLMTFLKATNRVLNENGKFLFTIIHPCFWPRYWGYEQEGWYEYNEEMIVESEFKISLEVATGHKATHIHRPISKYINALEEAGFRILKLAEPVPSENDQKKYPVTWSFPRFLAGICEKS